MQGITPEPMLFSKDKFWVGCIILVFLILSVISIGFPLVKGFMDQKKVKVV